MKFKFLIITLIVALNADAFAQSEFHYKCSNVRLNFNQMSKALEKVKRDQKFIFPERSNISFTPTNQIVPENLSTLLSTIQAEAFGQELLKLRSVGSALVSGDMANRSIDFDPKFIESLSTKNGYKDPDSLLKFLLAHEVSHYIQDFIALKKHAMETENKIPLVSDGVQSVYGNKMFFEVMTKKSGNLSDENLELYIVKNRYAVEVETDGYAYLLIKKLNYKMPNLEDFTKLLNILSGGIANSKEELFAPERCGVEQRRNLLVKRLK
jgi:hypothetical protein